MTDRLTPEEVQRVLRRATELGPERGQPGFDRDAVIAAAGEVGIDAAAIARALAEHDAGLIDAPSETGILGTSEVREVSEIALPREQVDERLDRWLRREMFVLHDRDGATTAWRPRDDLYAKIRRKLNVPSKVDVGHVEVIRTTTSPTPEGTLVRLEADLDGLQRGLRTGVVLAPAAIAPLGGAAMSVVAGTPLFLLLGVPLGLVLAGLGTLGARRTMQNARADAGRTLRLVLDNLER